MAFPPSTTPVPTTPLLPAMTPALQHRPKDTPDQPKPFSIPKLRLEIRDLSHPAARAFLTSHNAVALLTEACHVVLRNLYSSPTEPSTVAPNIRSLTLVLRDMAGVAYTTGNELDPDFHKEVHFSLRYIAGIKQERLAEEIQGVVTHELVHCFQYNGKGTCPGGLIEGVADWVRLQAKLGPPHWKRNADGKWDGGYEHTAYFLEYVEKRYGDGTVRRLNEKLRTQKYEEKPFWTELVGRPVEQLWEDYAKSLKVGEEGVKNNEAQVVLN